MSDVYRPDHTTTMIQRMVDRMPLVERALPIDPMNMDTERLLDDFANYAAVTHSATLMGFMDGATDYAHCMFSLRCEIERRVLAKVDVP
jgi:hypothetical protein